MNHLAAGGQPGVAENYCSVGANQGVHGPSVYPKKHRAWYQDNFEGLDGTERCSSWCRLTNPIRMGSQTLVNTLLL